MRYRVNPLDEQELLARARARFRLSGSPSVFDSAADDVPKLLEDLAVSKIELELQNAHLQEAGSKLESALRQSAELFDFSPVALFRLDAKGRISKSNLVASSLLETERAHLTGQAFDHFIRVEQRQQLYTLMERAKQFGVNQRCELGLLVAGLPSRELQVDIAPLGPGQGYLLTLIDITERKRLEQQLRADEQRWKFALDAAGDGVWDWNVQTSKVHYSSKLLQLYGYGPEEFSGTLEAWRALLHPEDQAEFLLAMQGCLTGHSPRISIEQRMRCKDGSWKWILCRGALFSSAKGGAAERLIGTHVDITGRKQMEIHFQQISGMQQITFDSLPNRVAVIDNDGLLLQTNAAWNAYLRELSHGYDAEDGWIGTHFERVVNCLIGYQPALEREAIDAIGEVISGLRNEYQLEYALTTDAVEHWHLMRVTSVQDGTARALVSHEDITHIHQELGQSLEEFQFLRVAQAEFSRAVRYGQPLVMLSIGLDAPAAASATEAIQKNLVRLVQGLLRSSDILGRSAGDTLSLVLPNTTREGGETLAARIVEAVSATPVEVDGSKVYLSACIGGRRLHLETSFADLQASTQRALKSAREQGGNRFVFDTTGTPCLW